MGGSAQIRAAALLGSRRIVRGTLLCLVCLL